MGPIKPLPRGLVDADRLLHRIHQEVVFSHHLNPVNGLEAWAAFRAGQDPPPFRYQAATWAPEVIQALDRVHVPQDHALGPILQAAIRETRAWAVALRDRTPAAFDGLSAIMGWDPDPDLLLAAAATPQAQDGAGSGSVDAGTLASHVRAALAARHLDGWRVVQDPVLGARVAVDAARRLVRVHPDARFLATDPARLVAHEIDVHAMRAHNGERQPLWLFSTGLPGSQDTEEGLALAAEERLGLLSPAAQYRQALLVRAIPIARQSSFGDLWAWLRTHLPDGPSWSVAMRLKRGLASPGAPGVYGKDVVYFRGFRKVKAWLAQGGDPSILYVGKVGLEQPLARWLEDGLLVACRAPALWRT